MNILRWPLPVVTLLLLLLAAGCSNRYVITTTSGARVITPRKPKLVDNKYVYRDGTNLVEIPVMRVRVIEPYSKKSASTQMLPPEDR